MKRMRNNLNLKSPMKVKLRNQNMKRVLQNLLKKYLRFQITIEKETSKRRKGNMKLIQRIVLAMNLLKVLVRSLPISTNKMLMIRKMY